MTLSANDLAAPSGDSFKFEQVGDTIEGAITYVGEPQERTNKFNGREEKVIKLGVDTGNGEIRYVWPVVGTQMAGAIAQALRDAGIDTLEEGQTLKLGFTSTKDTGKPEPMKVFTARITPAAQSATAAPF